MSWHSDAGGQVQPDLAPAVTAISRLGQTHDFRTILLSFSDFGGRQALMEAARAA